MDKRLIAARYALPLRKAIEEHKPVSITLGKYRYSVEKRYAYWRGENSLELIVFYVVSRWIPRESNFLYMDMRLDDIPEVQQIIWGDHIPKNSWGNALLKLLEVN